MTNRLGPKPPRIAKAPKDVRVSQPCVCTGTLGRLELETVAACVVLWHWENSPDAWVAISRRQIADWIPTSKHLAVVARNPFWKLDIAGFCSGGWIVGWERPGADTADDMGTVTAKFIDCVSNPSIGPR